MLALLEPYKIGFLADRPHLGCAMLIAACKASGIGVELIPGQVHWLRHTCLQGQKEFWHLLMEIPGEYAEQLHIKDIRDTAKNQGVEEFSRDLATRYFRLIELKTPQAYFNLRSLDQFARLADAAEKVFRFFLQKRKGTDLSIISDYVRTVSDSKARYLGVSLEAPMDPVTQTIMEEAKRRTGCTIILGGSMTPFLNREEIKTLLGSGVDYLVVGMAEQSLPTLIADLEGNRDPCLSPGVLAFRNGNLTGEPPDRLPPPNQLPLPDFSLFDLSRYFTPRVVLPFQTARGCSWQKCAFCTHSKIYLDQVQAFEIEKTAENIATLKEKYQCSHFVLHDEELPPARALALSKIILKKGITPVYFHCLARLSKGYDDERLLETMYRAGFRSVSWGMESGVPKVLRNMRKGTGVRQISRILHKAFGQGISNCCFIIFGFPGETLAEAGETVAFLTRHARVIQQVMIGSFSWAKGSPLDERPEEWGIEFRLGKPEAWEVRGGMSREELIRFMNLLAAKMNFGKTILCAVPCQTAYYSGNMVNFFKSAATPVDGKDIDSVLHQDTGGSFYPVSLGDLEADENQVDDAPAGEDQVGFILLNLSLSLWQNRFRPDKIRVTAMDRQIHHMADGRHTFRELVEKLAIKENLASGSAKEALVGFFRKMAKKNSLLLFQSLMKDPTP